MKNHYAITSTIRYYKPPCAVELLPGPHPRLRVMPVVTSGEAPFNFSRWKDAPHTALANLRDEPKAVLWFTRFYGVLARDYKGKARTVSIREVLDYRNFLRRAWEGDAENFFAQAGGNTVLWAHLAGPEVAVRDLWPLVALLFSQDWAKGLLGKCENPDCSAPYFRAVRKRQKFCGQKCAVLINVRRFREREAKLRAKIAPAVRRGLGFPSFRRKTKKER